MCIIPESGFNKELTGIQDRIRSGHWLFFPFIIFCRKNSLFPHLHGKVVFTNNLNLFCIHHAPGVYNVEALTDLNWNVMGYALNLLYHFIVLELFAIVRERERSPNTLISYILIRIYSSLPYAQPSQVNLNHMLCPAILDPFEGQNYRLFAVVHQSILCPLLCKIYCYLFQPVYEQEDDSRRAPAPLESGSGGGDKRRADADGGDAANIIEHPQSAASAINQNHCDNRTESKAIPHLLANSSSGVISKKHE